MSHQKTLPSFPPPSPKIANRNPKTHNSMGHPPSSLEVFSFCDAIENNKSPPPPPKKNKQKHKNKHTLEKKAKSPSAASWGWPLDRPHEALDMNGVPWAKPTGGFVAEIFGQPGAPRENGPPKISASSCLCFPRKTVEHPFGFKVGSRKETICLRGGLPYAETRPYQTGETDIGALRTWAKAAWGLRLEHGSRQV